MKVGDVAMVRNMVILSSLTGSGMILGVTSGFFEAGLMFMLFGIVPGDDRVLSAATMLMLYTAVLGAVVSFNVQALTRRFVVTPRRQNQTA